MANEEKVVTLTQLNIVKGYINTLITNHNNSETAHSFILNKIRNVEDRLFALEIANGGDITTNPFAVTFGSLDGTISDGVWDEANARLGF